MLGVLGRQWAAVQTVVSHRLVVAVQAEAVLHSHQEQWLRRLPEEAAQNPTMGTNHECRNEGLRWRLVHSGLQRQLDEASPLR